ncbi:MAG: response regulator [Streptosporangiales bacterium]|nr:response regulator [Streptosporangiales bacterium]
MVEKARILLVDDRSENLTALEAILSSLDQTLIRANSGEEALKALLKDDFAVILLDVQMPGMDGFETASHIKRREKTKDVPIIFLTVSHDPQHAFRGYASGAVDYLAKPFDPWVLRAKVSVFVDLYRKNRQLTEQATLLQYRLTAAAAQGSGGAENPASSGEKLLDELSRRLTAVEDQLDLVSSQAKVTVDGAMASSVTELTERVARLRAGLDALCPAP